MKQMLLLPAAVALLCWGAVATGAPGNNQAKQALGRKIFFDTNLSEPKGQSCASCHSPARAFSDPGPSVASGSGPSSQGAVKGLFGPRNSPSAMYASYAPPLQAAGEGDGSYMGGQFRDGRADSLEAQAQAPFLNPIEMNNPSSAAVVAKVSIASYAADFKAIYGAGIFDDVTAAYNAVADAIATFERGRELHPFSAKFDRVMKGQDSFSDAESRGFAVFTDAGKGNCGSCHPVTSPKGKTTGALFTDFGYDNIGAPRNPDLKFYDLPTQYNPAGRNYVDIGLGEVIPRDFTRGQFKAPTLRNIAVTGPYTHNGYFKTLRGVLDFYNTRDLRPACPDPFTTEKVAQSLGCWPVPEVPENVNRADMGQLGLSDQDIDDMLAFLGTLTDADFVNLPEQRRQTAPKGAAPIAAAQTRR